MPFPNVLVCSVLAVFGQPGDPGDKPVLGVIKIVFVCSVLAVFGEAGRLEDKPVLGPGAFFCRFLEKSLGAKDYSKSKAFTYRKRKKDQKSGSTKNPDHNRHNLKRPRRPMQWARHRFYA